MESDSQELDKFAFPEQDLIVAKLLTNLEKLEKYNVGESFLHGGKKYCNIII